MKNLLRVIALIITFKFFIFDSIPVEIMLNNENVIAAIICSCMAALAIAIPCVIESKKK